MSLLCLFLDVQCTDFPIIQNGNVNCGSRGGRVSCFIQSCDAGYLLLPGINRTYTCNGFMGWIPRIPPFLAISACFSKYMLFLWSNDAVIYPMNSWNGIHRKRSCHHRLILYMSLKPTKHKKFTRKFPKYVIIKKNMNEISSTGTIDISRYFKTNHFEWARCFYKKYRKID